jgi:tetratricopeptide (TPR) repeat protein
MNRTVDASSPRSERGGIKPTPWKRSLRAATGLLVLLASGSVSAVSRADTPPSRWDVAKDPFARDRWELHVKVENRMQPRSDAEGLGEDRRVVRMLDLERARADLEEADAEHSPDVRLQFDLGSVDYELGDIEARRDLFERAIAVLVPALERAPDHPAATGALQRLVYCYAKLNRPEDELSAWQRYIPRLSDDRARAAEMMNMGEAEMRLGHAENAVETFREVRRIVALLPNGVETFVLNEWDLAVALDRSGDSRGATEEASQMLGMGIVVSGKPLPKQASRAMRGTLILRQAGVFFVPAWEVEWYFAVAATADARDESDAREVSEAWAEAESHWKKYVENSSASSEHDPWLSIARVRLAHARTERIAAEARARRMPRPPPRPAALRSNDAH